MRVMRKARKRKMVGMCGKMREGKRMADEEE